MCCRSFRLRRDSSLHHVVGDTELLQRGGRTAVVAWVEHVSYVLKIFPADRAREESRRGHIPKAIEEGDAISHLGLGLVRKGDVIQHFAALFVRRGNER